MGKTSKHLKKKFKTMDIILVIVAAAALTFTIAMIRIFKDQGAIPDTLVTCVFAMLGGECGAMAWIKTVKEKYSKTEEDKDDE